jgi:SHS2 domain-containing protein
MQELPYTILDHSGDLRIKAEGENFLEALAHASCGLLSQITSPDTVQEANERPIVVTGESQSEQALAFLNELLFLAYGRHWLPKRVKWLTLCAQKGCLELEGTLTGETVDPSRHEFKYDIKAVTYHDFKIEQINGRTMIEFVCDL